MAIRSLSQIPFLIPNQVLPDQLINKWPEKGLWLIASEVMNHFIFNGNIATLSGYGWRLKHQHRTQDVLKITQISKNIMYQPELLIKKIPGR